MAMKFRHGKTLLVLALLWGVVCSIPSLAWTQSKTFVYEVKDGETCMSLAKRFYGDKNRYTLIHEYNPSLGPVPHDLQPGQKLTLPLLINDPDARITGRRGEVRARPPAKPSWASAPVGLELYRAWRVNSREEAAAELTFIDTSRLYMRENTLVIIYGSTSRKIRRRTTEAELQYGTLRARMDELAGEQKTLEVSTTASDTTLHGGEALIDVDDQNITRVANHRGRPAEVYGQTARKATRPSERKRKALQVAAGMGSKIAPNRDPTPPKPLPPAPAWQMATQRAVFAPGGKVAIFNFRWAPEPKAVRYRIEFFADGQRTRSLGATTTPGTEVELQQPDGSYFITVSSIDDDKFEGPPSPIAQVDVLPLKILGPNNVWLDDVAYIPAGSRLTPPREGCRLDGQPMEGNILLVEPGKHTLDCPTAGVPASIDLIVQPIEATWNAATQRNEAVLRRGAITQAEVHLSQDVHAPLKAKPPEGIEVGPLVKRESKRWGMTLFAHNAAPEQFELPIVLDMDGEPPIAVLNVQVSQTGGGAVYGQQDDEGIIDIELGALLDVGFLYGSNDTDEAAANRSLFRPGVRLGVLASQLIFVEAELAPVFDRPTGGHEGFTRFSYRVHGGLLLGGETLSPLVLVGRGSDLLFGAEDDVESLQSVNYVGLGLRWVLMSQTSLRLELRQGFVVQDPGKLANQTNATLGVQWIY
ncbi:MAG: LysM domain-containing protein [Myxococcota bacterium]